MPAASRALRSQLLKIDRTPLSHRCSSTRCMRCKPAGDNDQSGTGTPGSIVTSGWVMKYTILTFAPEGFVPCCSPGPLQCKIASPWLDHDLRPGGLCLRGLVGM